MHYELLLLCSHSHNDVPPEPQRNISMAAVRGAVHPSICITNALLRQTYRLVIAEGLSEQRIYSAKGGVFSFVSKSNKNVLHVIGLV